MPDVETLENFVLFCHASQYRLQPAHSLLPSENCCWGEILGLEGGLVRTAFRLVCSSQQLVPGRFGAVGLHSPGGDAGARLGEGERTMAAAEQEEGMQIHLF